MVKARKIVIASLFQGVPRPEDFRVEEEELPQLRDGQILAEAEYVSVDPYQRSRKHLHRVGDTMIGSQVARIVESRCADFPVGCHVVGYWGCHDCTVGDVGPGTAYFMSPAMLVARIVESRCADFPVGRHVVGYWGWRDRTVADVGPGAPYFMSPPMLVPDLGALPLSLSLGVLGMPGITAYFGLLEICRPKPGEVTVVSGAAGAVGSIVGQIARIKGCTVIGFTGSDAKVKWLKEELGFDHAFNYKTTDVTAALQQAAPGGVDVYFDNVGGEQSSAIINSMREWGRVAVCGSISGYNASEPPKAPIIQPAAVSKQLRIEGFMYTRWHDRWAEGIMQLKQWVMDGRIKYRETVTQGFHNTPEAFAGMLRGENLGKAVVKV